MVEGVSKIRKKERMDTNFTNVSHFKLKNTKVNYH